MRACVRVHVRAGGGRGERKKIPSVCQVKELTGTKAEVAIKRCASTPTETAFILKATGGKLSG